MTGSAALMKANEWTAEKMRSYGLTNVRLEPWVLPEGWERGTATARLLEPNPGQSIHIASLGWYPGTKGKIQGPVVVLKAESTKDLEAYKGKLKNAVVLLSPPRQVVKLDQLGKPVERSQGRVRPQGGFGKRSMTEMMSFRQSLAAFLVKEGAAAIFQDSAKPLGLLVTTGSWARGDRASATNRL